MHTKISPLTRQYAAFVAHWAKRPLPSEVCEVATLGFTDTVGVMLAVSETVRVIVRVRVRERVGDRKELPVRETVRVLVTVCALVRGKKSNASASKVLSDRIASLLRVFT